MIRFPFSRFSVRDKSMEPMFRQNDNVLTVNWGNIIKGSVVVFKDEDKYIIKRVKHLKGDRLIIGADNKKLAKKEWNLGQDEIVGRVFLKY